jgi:hypothetical protein
LIGVLVGTVQVVSGPSQWEEKEDMVGNRPFAALPWVQAVHELVKMTRFSIHDHPEVTLRVATADTSVSSLGRVARMGDHDAQYFGSLFRPYFTSAVAEESGQQDDQTQSSKEVFRFQSGLVLAGVSRRPFLTSDKRVGIAPDICEPGDGVVIFYGAGTPFILRPGENGQYRFIGEAYVHGIMDGEFLENDPLPKTFVLY